MSPADVLAQPFGNFADLVRLHAARRPDHGALAQGERRISYAQLDRAMDRVAAGLRRDGVGPRDSVAICGANGIVTG